MKKLLYCLLLCLCSCFTSCVAYYQYTGTDYVIAYVADTVYFKGYRPFSGVYAHDWEIPEYRPSLYTGVHVNRQAMSWYKLPEDANVRIDVSRVIEEKRRVSSPK